jgi:selenocysteine-specific elongation factor
MSEMLGTNGGVVLGTAGHIDHGKTTLVRALTGMETDRLAEEKKRGISIELGFADMALPTGIRVSIIDVPGHERFIKNMLAGAGGIDAVLLVIAADEGLKPQTREHFEICRLLGIRDGVIVLTKADLANPDQMRAVKSDVKNLCAGTFLENSACVEVSAHNRWGLDALVTELVSLTKRLPGRPAQAYARLPVDRSFTMQGFGTVVTGTLMGGTLHLGEMVEIHPLRKQFRIRGIQVHRNRAQEARAGQRTAVNLAGIEADQIKRGSVLATPDTFESTTIFDAEVTWLEEKFAARTRQPLQLHVACVESTVDVRLIEQVGERKTATRISSRHPLLILPGDRFVLRNSMTTVGGGRVIDPCPPIRLNRAKTAVRLRNLSSANDGERLKLLVEEGTQGRKINNLVKATGWTPQHLKSLAAADTGLYVCEVEQRVISLAWLEQKREQVTGWLEHFHKQNPSASGAPIHQARGALMSGIEPRLAESILRNTPGVTVSGETISLAAHKAKTSTGEMAVRDKLEQLYRTAALAPPLQQEALAAAGVSEQAARIQLELLVKAKTLVRLSSDLLVHAEAIKQLKESLQTHKGRRFSVPEFKQWTNISRKFAIPLLEYLDRQHVTKREGDARVVL